jgi:EAL domain-containing protein (putative c-di-GMP-specific phosphodiesterase class I)/CheY-like chemotaxis protein
MIPVSEEPLRVLLIDDHAQVRTAFRRVLDGAGYAVTCEDDVPSACARLRAGDSYDVVLTDLQLPSGTGLDVMAAAHDVDPALPVVFVTGTGDIERAQLALEHGALRYLTKPVGSTRLLAAMEEATRARMTIRHSRSAGRLRSFDRDLAQVRQSVDLDAALARLWIAFQPVVSVSRRRVVAFEALVRSDHPALARPDLLIAAAEELGRMPELSRRIRALCASGLAGAAPDAELLVNLHPSDLEDPELFDPAAPLARHASRVILEITERASLDGLADVQERIERLRALGYRIAVDDLGAGYGSLSAIALIRPDLVKLDMSLVRNCHEDRVRTRMVRSIGMMCQQLGTAWLCEGVETMAELRAVVGAGVDLVQGYLLGRPSRELTGPAPEVMEALPRLARASRPSQRIALGAMAQGLCREALTVLAVRGDGDRALTDELRVVLAALSDVLDYMEEGLPEVAVPRRHAG